MAALEAGMAAGQFRRQPVRPLAHLVFGAIVQAGMVVSRAEDPRRERAALSRSFRALLDGIRS